MVEDFLFKIIESLSKPYELCDKYQGDSYESIFLIISISVNLLFNLNLSEHLILINLKIDSLLFPFNFCLNYRIISYGLLTLFIAFSVL